MPESEVLPESSSVYSVQGRDFKVKGFIKTKETREVLAFIT
ncbi:unnamed protein product, partial [marine sediment metagenome]